MYFLHKKIPPSVFSVKNGCKTGFDTRIKSSLTYWRSRTDDSLDLSKELSGNKVKKILYKIFNTSISMFCRKAKQESGEKNRYDYAKGLNLLRLS